MEQYVIKGGNPLVGDVTISGAKNAALGILAASIMTDDDVLIDNLPDVRDINVLLEAIEEIGARECSLSQMLYFIDKGTPVIAYTGPGTYILLSGYDQYNVSLYDPETQESWKMGMNDATAYFESLQNDFICGKIVQ